MKLIKLVLALLLVANNAWGAAPVVATSAGNSDPAATTSRNATNPASISAGDTLVGAICLRDSAGATTGWPAGWTERHDTGFNASVTLSVAVKIADGTEGATTTITSANGVGVWRLFRVTGAHASSLPEAGTPASAVTTTPNPPTVTPSWGSDDILVFAIECASTTSSTVSAYPTNYTDNQSNGVSTGAPGVTIGIATRALTGVSSENPGTFTINTNDNTVASTVAVRAAAPATPGLGILGGRCCLAPFK